MKKYRISLMILSIIFLALSIISIVFSESKVYGTILLIVIYLPTILIMNLSKSFWGKIFSIGFCGIGILSGILILIAFIISLKNIELSTSLVISIVSQVLEAVIKFIMLLSFVKTFKEQENKKINKTAVLLSAIFLILLIVYIVLSDYSLKGTMSSLIGNLSIIKDLIFMCVLLDYLLMVSKKEYIQELLDIEK